MKEQTMTVFLFIFSVDTAQCSFYLHSYHSIAIVADWVGPSQGFSATLWVQLRDKVCCWWIGFFVREDVFVNAMKARRGLRSDKVHCLKGVSGLLYAPHHQKNDKERCFHKIIKMQLQFNLHRPLNIKHSQGNSPQKNTNHPYVKHDSPDVNVYAHFTNFLHTLQELCPRPSGPDVHCTLEEITIPQFIQSGLEMAVFKWGDIWNQMWDYELFLPLCF